MLSRQAPHAAKSQPPVQADGVQQLADFEQFADANGNTAYSVDAWGNNYSAARSENIRTITASTTAVGTEADGTPDSTILLNANGLTLTLPSVSANKGKRITVKVISATSTGTVSGGGVNIDGASTYSLSAQYKYVTVQSNGTQWFVVANN